MYLRKEILKCVWIMNKLQAAYSKLTGAKYSHGVKVGRCGR
jgi:hypothetical protein